MVRVYQKTNGILFLFWVGFIALTLHQDVFAEVTPPALGYNCKKVMGRLIKRMVKNLGVCAKELKANTSSNAEVEKKMNCLVKCSLEKFDMLDAEGKISMVTVQIFVNETIPDAPDMGKLLLDRCVDRYGSILDKMQPYCESYGDFGTCLRDVLGEFGERPECKIGGLGR